ncbi:hypothetical protein [Actinomycetospora aeridis]|uniref:Uncharacterized protein n=1 Tax=Actinomycetospora aeridis TaxID=3129231 RepID=A0ABU8N147_9PSEU
MPTTISPALDVDCSMCGRAGRWDPSTRVVKRRGGRCVLPPAFVTPASHPKVRIHRCLCGDPACAVAS